MAIYERPVWKLMQEFAGEHPGEFRFAELDSWFQRRYPAIQSSTIRAHLHAMTKGSGSGSLPRIFTRIEHGLYRARVTEAVGVTAKTPSVRASPGAADVVLVTCVKTKRSAPAPAKDLYISALFQKQRSYAEQTGVPWYILSAEYGLVKPDEWLSPYERYLPDCPPSYQRAWAQWVAARLELLQGGLRGAVVEIHASSLYASCLSPELLRRGASVSTPLAGLSQGGRLAWYGDTMPLAQTRIQEPDSTSGLAASVPLSALVGDLVAKLSSVANARPPADLRNDRRSLSSPGLYSWWVDPLGARDLSAGLGMAISAGLIYAGQAGATRWPSGRRSANTLWLRLVGMHLDGSAEFSTFRRTLGAILADPIQLGHADDAALTRWIEEHLLVIAVPVDDADGLMAVEHEVLNTLDPPLNLSGRPSTPARRRLSELRRKARDLRGQ